MGCEVDATGAAYVVGSTNSPNQIAMAGAYQDTLWDTRGDVFVAKFSPNGVRQWGTYYGGSQMDWADACTADQVGVLYVVGYTSSVGGIASTGAFQDTLGRGEDAFMVKFEPTPASLSGPMGSGSVVRVWANGSTLYVAGTGIEDLGPYQVRLFSVDGREVARWPLLPAQVQLGGA